VVIAGDGGDVVAGPELALDVPYPGAHRRRAHSSAVEQDDHGGLAVSLRLDQVGGADALGRRVVVAVRGQVLGDGAADCDREDEEDGGADADEPAALVDEPGEGVEHQAVLLSSASASAASSRAARSHQSAIHWLHS